MSRNGILIAVAVVIAISAAAVMVWTNFVEGEKSPEGAPASTASAPETAPPRQEQLITDMFNAGGGYAATFSEADVGKWSIADGHRIERFSIGDRGTVFARLTSAAKLDQSSVAWPSLGLHTVFPAELATSSDGQLVEVGFVARSAQTNGSPELAVVYATRIAGNSRWQLAKLTPEFELYKFTYRVPHFEPGYTSGPIVVVHSDPSGGGRAVELIGLYVKILPQ